MEGEKGGGKGRRGGRYLVSDTHSLRSPMEKFHGAEKWKDKGQI